MREEGREACALPSTGISELPESGVDQDVPLETENHSLTFLS